MNTIKELIEFCKLVYDRGYTIATDGNLSIRNDEKIVITPSGFIKSLIGENDLIYLSLDGSYLKKNNNKPSMEKEMHLNIYRSNFNINSVIHVHPFFTNLYFLTHETIELSLLPEIDIYVKNLSIIPFYPAGSKELAQAVKKQIKGNEGIIVLKKHGVIAYGDKLSLVFSMIERLEYYAKLLYYIEKNGNI